MEEKFKLLSAEIEQSDIAAERWNVVQLMRMHIDATYVRISDLNFPSRSLPADPPGERHRSASQVTSQLPWSEHRKRT